MLAIFVLSIQLSLVFGSPLVEEFQEKSTEDSGVLGVANSSIQCPTWYIPTSSGCSCSDYLGHVIRCYGHDRVKLQVTYCMSYDQVSQQTLVANCPYINKDVYTSMFVEQPKNESHLNEELCGWANRTGFLCSRCKDGLGVATMTYSHTCLKCIGKLKGWILYFFLALTPATIFFIFIIVCRIRTTSAKMNTMVCIFQVMIFYMDKYPNTIRRSIDGKRDDFFLLAVATVGGIWNLDFFRHIMPPFCISEHLTTLNTLSMEYIVAIYPLFLTLFTYVCMELYSRDYRPIVYLWLPFKLCLSKIPSKIDFRHSIIDAFATLLQLSYSKLIFVSLNLLSFVEPVNTRGAHHSPVLYYDPEVAYLSRTHIPYFVLSLTILSIFVFSPMILLFVYPNRTFQTLLGLFPRVNWLPLHAFADAFNGCYKNGTKGTKDYRFFGGFFLFFRVLLFLPAMSSSYISVVWTTLTPFLGVLMFGFLRPYKKDLYNRLDAFYWSVLQLMRILALYNLHFFHIPLFVQVIWGTIPFLHMAVIIISELLSACCPTTLEKIKRVLWSSSKTVDEPATSSQQSNHNDNGAAIDCSNRDVADQLLSPETVGLLQTKPLELSAYGACDS